MGVLARQRVGIVPNEKQITVRLDPQHSLDHTDFGLERVGHEDHVAHGQRRKVLLRKRKHVAVSERWPHAIPLDADIQGVAHRRPSGCTNPGDVSPLGGPKHLVNGLAGVHQFLSVVCRDFDLAGRTQLGGMPKRVMKVGDGFKVLRFEEVRPQNEEFVLALLSLFFFDGGVAGHRVHVGRHGDTVGGVRAGHGQHLLRHGLNGFSGDSGAGWVVHTAGCIAVGFGENRGLHVVPERSEP